MSKKQQGIDILLIEDDPMVQEVNRQFIEAVPPFQVIDIASDGKEGVHLAEKLAPDLIILDIYMPGLNGMDTLKEIRKHAFDVDVIVITAANDKEMVRTMFQNGVVDYILKPFKFERLQQSLINYKTYHSQINGEGALQQEQVDGLIGSYVKEGVKELPKGLNQQTLDQILQFLQQSECALSAEQVADGIGMARVTARRYLEYLQKIGEVDIEIQYGGIGRPVNRYKMKW
ncbi:two-component system, CitB family, response regulator DctR [Halobacillus dabanensis]|uniref:Two-component system, CitB family, response regulator DctR n=1 Tax=Halobacillus dabanensis TaxID=240302 RepID=A0A1I3RQ46_HALDA|nr:response regulator [Halobacillus dabanensis]SFJ48693.1 two-component system, CitB family, response regulator DctR [Halobacillus dabanensis]